jgi:hypothetical protein
LGRVAGIQVVEALFVEKVRWIVSRCIHVCSCLVQAEPGKAVCISFVVPFPDRVAHADARAKRQRKASIVVDPWCISFVVPFPDRVAHADARAKRQRKASIVVDPWCCLPAICISIVVPFPDRVAHADARAKRQRKGVVQFSSVRFAHADARAKRQRKASIGLLTLTRELSASARLLSVRFGSVQFSSVRFGSVCSR